VPGFWQYSNENSIMEKISMAGDFWTLNGEEMRHEPLIQRRLDRYRQEILRTQCLMMDLGVVSGCASCATGIPGGGCCGAGIEDWYDELLLLFNLMLGRSIPLARAHGNDCLFLGSKGCLLLARHHFCVNYLCSRITGKLSPGDLSALEAQGGAELFVCWELEGLVRARIRQCKEMRAGGDSLLSASRTAGLS
jgi:hypothetical protein